MPRRNSAVSFRKSRYASKRRPRRAEAQIQRGYREQRPFAFDTTE